MGEERHWPYQSLCTPFTLRQESYQKESLLERDVLRPRLLRAFGRNIVFVLTKDLFERASTVMDAIEQKLSKTAPAHS
jgi:hypothetical protein